jgi:hypothetical protein
VVKISENNSVHVGNRGWKWVGTTTRKPPKTSLGHSKSFFDCFSSDVCWAKIQGGELIECRHFIRKNAARIDYSHPWLGFERKWEGYERMCSGSKSCWESLRAENAPLVDIYRPRRICTWYPLCSNAWTCWRRCRLVACRCIDGFLLFEDGEDLVGAGQLLGKDYLIYSVTERCLT